MHKYFKLHRKTSQTAVEYLLLLAVVVAVVLVGFRNFLPDSQRASERYYNEVTDGLMGDPVDLTP